MYNRGYDIEEMIAIGHVNVFRFDIVGIHWDHFRNCFIGIKLPTIHYIGGSIDFFDLVLVVAKRCYLRY